MNRRLFKPIVGAAVVMLLSVLPALAGGPHWSSGALQLRFGGYFPDGDSDFWRENQDVFTLDTGDFDDVILGFTFVTPVSNNIEVGFNVDYYDQTALSAYRDFVDSAGFPIFHDTTLTQIPLSLDLRFLPTGRYRVRGARGQYHVRQPVFYLGGGIGTTYWEYEEIGDFLDFQFDPPEIFFDRFIDKGWAFSAHALAGIEFPMSEGFGILVEGRFRWADDKLEDDFAGLGTIDLDGPAIYVGGSFQF